MAVTHTQKLQMQPGYKIVRATGRAWRVTEELCLRIVFMGTDLGVNLEDYEGGNSDGYVIASFGHLSNLKRFHEALGRAIAVAEAPGVPQE